VKKRNKRSGEKVEVRIQKDKLCKRKRENKRKSDKKTKKERKLENILKSLKI